jgi:light-regulated signal transduction histidine kinase (bacteriophytochrome)
MVELATRIGDASERMQALISALRTYAPVGGAQLQRRRVDLSGAVEHARSAVSVAIREKDAEIRVGALPEVVDDEPRLVQLMQNLLANALTFTPGSRRSRSPPAVKPPGGR